MRRQAGERHPPRRRGPLASPRPERHDLPAEHRQRHTTAAALRGCAGVCRAGEEVRPLPGDSAGWGSAGPKSAGAAAPLAGRLFGVRASDPPGNRNGSPAPAHGRGPPSFNPTVLQQEGRHRQRQLNPTTVRGLDRFAPSHTRGNLMKISDCPPSNVRQARR